MRQTRIACWIAVAALLVALPAASAQNTSASRPPAKVDAAFTRFWAANSPAEAEQAAAEIEKTGVAFDDAFRLLRLGRTYAAQKTGVIQLTNRTSDRIEHFFAVDVPDNYDPARRYQVRFQLHGGIGGRSGNEPRGDGTVGTLTGAEQIYVVPYAWDAEPWWSDDQVLNLNAILDTLKRTYNVDENRVVLSGVSDGGTGTYYVAMRDTTPFASFLPLNGFIMVLASRTLGANDGRLFPNNLLNKPIFVVNGGQDRLYPIRIVEPFTRHLMNAGVTIDYHPRPDGEHNTKWWPDLKDLYEKFVADHPRDPNPEKLTWQTADLSHNRAHWLVIDALGPAPGEAKDLPDANAVSGHEPDSLLAEIDELFARSKDTGRVDLVRTGNIVRATTTGVAAFTLLLSPDVFDFSQPVTVIANGREAFHGRVERSLPTLLKWAARDNDRTMLYAAELHIKLTDTNKSIK